MSPGLAVALWDGAAVRRLEIFRVMQDAQFGRPKAGLGEDSEGFADAEDCWNLRIDAFPRGKGTYGSLAARANALAKSVKSLRRVVMIA